MTTVQLQGRALYENQRPYGPGVSPLWSRVRAVPYQESILVYNNGDLIRGTGFDNDQISDPDVAYFIQGGHRFYCEVGSSIYNILTAAGYTWQEVPEYDSYTSEYTDVYP